VSVCQCVCLSHGLNLQWSMQCKLCVRGHLVQPLSNYFDVVCIRIVS